jgi:hypothetical protein
VSWSGATLFSPPLGLNYEERNKMLETLRERLAERSRQKFLDRCHDSNDPVLRERLIAVVDAIIERAVEDGWFDLWKEEEMEHITVELPFRPVGSAQRTVHVEGCRAHAIYTEHRRNPDAGPWLYTSTADDADFGVRFMPGGGFTTAEGFLEHVAIEAGVHSHR